MAFPTIIMHDRKIILLNGYVTRSCGDAERSEAFNVNDKERLQQAVAQNPDATAFGYLEGRWFPGA
jgi:hypothetical protein